MAAAICVSASVIDELNLAGCPTVPVPTNDAILYDPVEVVNWMKSKRNEVDPEDFELTPLGKQLSTPESAESEA